MTANGRAYDDVLIAGTAAFSAAGAGGQPLLSATAGTQPFSRQPLAHTRAGTSGPEVYAAHCPPPPVAELLGARGVRTLCYEARMFASAGVAALRAAGWPPGLAEMVVCGTVNTGLDDLDTVLDEIEREGAERGEPGVGRSGRLRGRHCSAVHGGGSDRPLPDGLVGTVCRDGGAVHRSGRAPGRSGGGGAGRGRRCAVPRRRQRFRPANRGAAAAV